MNNSKNKDKIFFCSPKKIKFIFLSLFFLIHLNFVYSVDVDFLDIYAVIGSSTDKISWVDATCPALSYAHILGVENNNNEVFGYCVNNDRELNSVYDFCLIKNSTFTSLCSSSMPLFPVADTQTSSDWAESLNVGLFQDVLCGVDGNLVSNQTKQKKRSQIEYFGFFQELDTNNSFDSSSISFHTVGDARDIATNFIAGLTTITNISIYISVDSGSPGSGEDLTLSIRETVDGANLVSKTIAGENINADSFNMFDIPDLNVTISLEYFIIVSCTGCSSGTDWNWHRCETGIGDCNGNGTFTDGGGSPPDNNWDIQSTTRRRSYLIYGDSGCESLGTSSNDASGDYYYVDKLENFCDFDGSTNYDIDGYYGVTQRITLESDSCVAGLVCDTAHDNQQSIISTNKPTHPCKIDTGFACLSSPECWQDAVCSGNRIDYRGLCDGDLVDITAFEYADGCGGIGALDTIDNSDSDNSCEIDGGFASGFICDDTLDGDNLTSKVAVYNAVCKGGLGNACSIDSDCHNSFDCIGGFCALDIFTIYTDNVDPNSINKTETVNYDSSLSTSSDSNIQFECWLIDSVNDGCHGNVTQCTFKCAGASFINSSLGSHEITFNNGGNFLIRLFSGSDGLYESFYEESYCVSGDGTNCFSCFDGLLNDDETSIDWGGNCGFPYFIRCNNNILDSVTNETSIDYGGFCGECDNSSVNLDEDLIFLKQTNQIIYPFNKIQCSVPVEIKGGITVFLLILTSILLIPIFIILTILIIILLFILFGGFGILTTIGGKNFNKMKSLMNRNKKK